MFLDEHAAFFEHRITPILVAIFPKRFVPDYIWRLLFLFLFR